MKHARHYQQGLIRYGKFIPAELCTFSAQALFASGFFTELYFSRGLSESIVGIIASLCTASAAVGNLFFGRLCDRLSRRKPVFLGCITLCLCATGAARYASAPWLLILCAMLCYFSFACLPAVLDTWLLAVLRRQKRAFSLLRMFGSLGAAFTALFCGRLLQAYGWNTLPLLAGLLLVIAWGFTLPIKEDISQPQEQKSVPPPTLKELFSNRVYGLLLLILCLLTLTTGPYYTFLPVLIENAGGGSAQLGLINTLQSLAEIPMFLLFPLFSKKLQPRKLLLLSLLLYSLRYLLLFLGGTFPLLYFITPLQGIAYGLYLPCFRLLIARLAPADMQTGAQSVAEAITVSGAGCVSGILSGVLVSFWGYPTLLLLSALSCAAAAALYLFLLPRIPKENAKNTA